MPQSDFYPFRYTVLPVTMTNVTQKRKIQKWEKTTIYQKDSNTVFLSIAY